MGKRGAVAAPTRTVDKQERQTNLVLFLLNSTTPISLSKIRSDVPGYEGNQDAARQKFERDKRELRTAGIEIRNFPLDSDDQVGYRIEPSSFWLPDLGLDDEEARALGLAAATLGFGGDGVARVLLDAQPPVPTGALASLPALPYLFRAMAGRCAVTFVHKDKERHVAPGTLTRHADRWYLGAIDLDKLAPRHFRVDRISGVPKVDQPGTAVLEEDQLAELRAATPWESRDDSRAVRVRIDAAIARTVVAELGEDAVLSRNDDGGVDVGIGWGLPGLARGWVLAQLQHAEVRSPSRVRDDVVEWLSAVRDAGRTTPGGVIWRSSREAVTAAPSAAQRLLAVLTTLAQQRKVSLTALAMRFGLTKDAMRTVLLEAACMGVPPFLHGNLLDIQVPLDDDEGDEVIWEDSGLFRPQLTWRDGFELAASARAAIALTGADDRGALARALAKLEEVTGAHVDVDASHPAALAPVESAVADRRQLLITYYSASSDSLADRRVDPVALRERAGRFYVLAWCHLANGWRTFRVDRIEQAADVGPRAHDGAPPPFDDVYGFADAERVDVALGAGAAWIAETEGVDLVGDLADGRIVARLRVASATYLERLLLQAGPDAEVLAPPALERLAANAASRVLARYRA
jgi:predicted DNA-binding transcriptional regulator YafY